MENFEKCTVAMLGGPCLQHITGNTSQQNQPQSAIISWSRSLSGLDGLLLDMEISNEPMLIKSQLQLYKHT